MTIPTCQKHGCWLTQPIGGELFCAECRYERAEAEAARWREAMTLPLGSREFMEARDEAIELAPQAFFGGGVVNFDLGSDR